MFIYCKILLKDWKSKWLSLLTYWPQYQYWPSMDHGQPRNQFWCLMLNSFQIIEKTWFFIKCYCDLDIWPADLKSVGVIYWPWPIFLPSRMTVTYKLFKILSRHDFCINCYCDLDLWPSDLKMYRGHLLTMSNLSTNYHDCHSQTYQDIEWTWFLH